MKFATFCTSLIPAVVKGLHQNGGAAVDGSVVCGFIFIQPLPKKKREIHQLALYDTSGLMLDLDSETMYILKDKKTQSSFYK